MKIDTLINAVFKLENRMLSRNLTPREERQFSAFFESAYENLLYKPSGSIWGTQKVIGKHKLPRYMYHITTKSAYESMLKDGCIKPSQCMDSSSGTFLFDMKNFTRFWRKTPDVVEQPRTTLLDWVGKTDSEEIVMLKIPTKKLNAQTMRLRRQKLCRYGAGGAAKAQEKFAADEHRFSHALEEMRYAMQGEDVSKLPLYNQRKEAVEYIVPEEIPIENVTLLGQATPDKKTVQQAAKEMRDLPEFWLKLTEGTPEQTAFRHLVQ